MVQPRRIDNHLKIGDILKEEYDRGYEAGRASIIDEFDGSVFAPLGYLRDDVQALNQRSGYGSVIVEHVLERTQEVLDWAREKEA